MEGAPQLDQGGTRARLDCTMRPRAFESFIEWCNEHEEECAEVEWLILQRESRWTPHSVDWDISLCLLHRILARLPKVHVLSLYGLVFSRCALTTHIDDHDHAPRPPCPKLDAIYVASISIRYPFEFDPAQLCNISPNVDVFHLGGCWALPRLPVGVCLPQPPQTMLSPPPSLDMRLAEFAVGFPTPQERQKYKVADDWYDYTKRLPTNRGTRYLVIDDIDPTAAPSVGLIISTDAATLKRLALSFQPRFQDCPQGQWIDLSFAECTQLRDVKLTIPIVPIIRRGESRPARFDAIADLIALLPPALSSIHLELQFCAKGLSSALQSAISVPWSSIDASLKANQSTAMFEVQSWCALERMREGAAAMRKIVHEGMPHALEDGRLHYFEDEE